MAKNKFIGSGVFAVDSTGLYVCNSSTKYENTGTIIKDRKKRKGYKLITIKYVGSLNKKQKEKPEIFVAAIVVPLNKNESSYLIPLKS